MAEQICHSQLNHSPAKQLFSFARETRFTTVKPNCDVLSYIPQSQPRRKGHKSTFGDSQYTVFYSKEHHTRPSPAQYKIKSQFDRPRSNHGSTFGVSRAAFRKVVSNQGCNYEVHDPALPGPGYYQCDERITKDRYTIKKQRKPKRKQCLTCSVCCECESWSRHLHHARPPGCQSQSVP